MQPVVTAKRLGWLAATTIILGVIIGAGAGLLTLLLYGDRKSTRLNSSHCG